MSHLRHYLSVIILAAAASVLVCCGSDDDSNNSTLDPELLKGTWVCLDEVAATATILSIGNGNALSGEIFEDISANSHRTETLSGKWAFFPANNVLNMDILYGSTLEAKTTPYQVQQLNQNTMVLRNQSLGSVERYHKVIGRDKKAAGQAFDIPSNNDAAASFSTTNNAVATVDERGHVTTVGSGIAFIKITTGTATNVYIIEVPYRVEDFLTELSSDIDAIRKAHGNPDAEGRIQNMAIVYRQSSFDKDLSVIQYEYDEQTREITRITTIYRSASVFELDKTYITSNYVETNLMPDTYGEYESFISCKFFVYPRLVENEYYVSYLNAAYQREHGHF